jgi:hypothetical protein
MTGSVIGAAIGKPTSAPWSRSVFPGSIRPEIGQRNRGARGEHYPPPLSPLQKRPSVRNPLTPRYRQENRGRLPRALSASCLALLAPRYRTSGHNSARVRAVYIRTRQLREHCYARPGQRTPRGIPTASGTTLHCVWEPGWRRHRSRGNYVRTSEAWPTSAPYRSRSRG